MTAAPVRTSPAGLRPPRAGPGRPAVPRQLPAAARLVGRRAELRALTALLDD